MLHVGRSTKESCSSLSILAACLTDREMKLRELEFVALNQLLIALASKVALKKSPSKGDGGEDEGNK